MLWIIQFSRSLKSPASGSLSCWCFCSFPLARQRFCWVTDSMTHAGTLCDVQMLFLRRCLKSVWSRKYHPFALMRHHVCCGSTRPRMSHAVKALVLGQIFLCQPGVLRDTAEFVCSFSLSKSQLGLVKKSGERQQRCDNPRVKGVNMRREFHAWRVCRMAPVFSLFTHANEQYADEWTWAQPLLPAAQNWQKACLCGLATFMQIPLCVVVSHGFWEIDAGFFFLFCFVSASEISAEYCQ